MTRHVILFLAANPRATDELPLREKLAAVERGLASARHRADFQLVPCFAITADELISQLNELATAATGSAGSAAEMSLRGI